MSPAQLLRVKLNEFLTLRISQMLAIVNNKLDAVLGGTATANNVYRQTRPLVPFDLGSRTFVGREAQLEELKRGFNVQRRMALQGLGGIG